MALFYKNRMNFTKKHPQSQIANNSNFQDETYNISLQTLNKAFLETESALEKLGLHTRLDEHSNSSGLWYVSKLDVSDWCLEPSQVEATKCRRNSLTYIKETEMPIQSQHSSPFQRSMLRCSVRSENNCEWLSRQKLVSSIYFSPEEISTCGYSTCNKQIISSIRESPSSLNHDSIDRNSRISRNTSCSGLGDYQTAKKVAYISSLNDEQTYENIPYRMDRSSTLNQHNIIYDYSSFNDRQHDSNLTNENSYEKANELNSRLDDQKIDSLEFSKSFKVSCKNVYKSLMKPITSKIAAKLAKSKNKVSLNCMSTKSRSVKQTPRVMPSIERLKSKENQQANEKVRSAQAGVIVENLKDDEYLINKINATKEMIQRFKRQQDEPKQIFVSKFLNSGEIVFWNV
jgi:hypothetical protein